ncbi:MAG: DUF4143 domain-containing protein [Thiolinea sp.]
MIITRHLQTVLLSRAQQYPVVTVTGPRQSGKTTLCQQTFPAKPYTNLERPDVREFARSDPRAFLGQFAEQGAVLDEIQRVPELLSWIQVEVDEQKRMGQFILTGSHQFDLSREISQSLAGRTALLKLLPLSISELRGEESYQNLSTDALIHKGGYPRIYEQQLDPAMVLGDYFETYVQRDLRELIQLKNIQLFEKFVRLAAGRIGQLLNLQSLGNDVGVSGHTVSEWLSLLEASYIVFRLPPWFANIGKRLIKSPKLYFYDVGLAAWLIGITREAHLATHPLRGYLFENLVVLEALKTLYNRGEKSNLYFYRDAAKNEADLVLEEGDGIRLLEIKSAQTVASDALRPTRRVADILGERVKGMGLVYGEKTIRNGQILRSCLIGNWEDGYRMPNTLITTFTIRLSETGETFTCRSKEMLLSAMLRLGKKAYRSVAVAAAAVSARLQIQHGEYAARNMSRAHVSVHEEAEGFALACRCEPQSDLSIKVVGQMRKRMQASG